MTGATDYKWRCGPWLARDVAEEKQRPPRSGSARGTRSTHALPQIRLVVETGVAYRDAGRLAPKVTTPRARLVTRGIRARAAPVEDIGGRRRMCGPGASTPTRGVDPHP
ncbi:hypothetical protein GCM10025787_16320 [Saccharopolyspora rosea]